MGLISFVWNLLTLPLTIAIYIFKTILFLPLNIAIFCFKTLVLRPVEISYRLFVTYPRFLYKVLYVGPRVVIDLVHSLEYIWPYILSLAALAISIGLVAYFAYSGICSLLSMGSRSSVFADNTASIASPAPRDTGTESKSSSYSRPRSTTPPAPALPPRKTPSKSLPAPPVRLSQHVPILQQPSLFSPALSPLNSPLLSRSASPPGFFSPPRHTESYNLEMAALMSQRHEELLAQHEAEETRRRIAAWKQAQERAEWGRESPELGRDGSRSPRRRIKVRSGAGDAGVGLGMGVGGDVVGVTGSGGAFEAADGNAKRRRGMGVRSGRSYDGVGKVAHARGFMGQIIAEDDDQSSSDF